MGKSGSITVTLRFFNKRNAAKYRKDSSVKGLRENEILVLSALKEHPDYSLDKIAAITGLGRSTVGKSSQSFVKPDIWKDQALCVTVSGSSRQTCDPVHYLSLMYDEIYNE